MIEPTDEMKDAFEKAAYPPGWIGGDPLWERGLAAVLAIVERDSALTGLERDVVTKAKRWAASDDAYDTEQLLSAVDQLTQYDAAVVQADTQPAEDVPQSATEAGAR